MSRSLTDLALDMYQRAVQFETACANRGFDELIYSTLRTHEEQAKLFRQGRSLKAIQRKADQLKNRYKRQDLAEILMGVGPQHEKRIVTYAGPGQSLHNYGLAFDGVPLRHGKPVWSARSQDDKALWLEYGAIAEGVGLEWAGRWKRFREYPHCQQAGSSWRELIQGR